MVDGEARIEISRAGVETYTQRDGARVELTVAEALEMFVAAAAREKKLVIFIADPPKPKTQSEAQ